MLIPQGRRPLLLRKLPMYPLPSHSIGPHDNAAAALAANAHNVATNIAPPLSHRQGGCNTVASALQAARMGYRDLASDIKLTIAAYAPTARDLESLIDADPSSGEQWQPPLVRAILCDEIAQFSDGPQRMPALHALVHHITNAQPKPSTRRDALLAHLIKKAIHTFASKDIFELSRWPRREIEREATLLTARTDLQMLYRTILPLASATAVDWFRETHLGAQLRLETMRLMTPIGAEKIWSMLQSVESDVSAVKLKSELLSDIVHALSDRMNNDGQHTTQDICLRILDQLSSLPAKHRVTLLKALMQQRRILPELAQDHILDPLLQQAKSLPLEYQQMKAPVRGQALTAATAATASLRVIEFADNVTLDKWLASLDRLIDLVPEGTGDRAIALGSLAVKCVRHAKEVRQRGGDTERDERTLLRAFEKILTAIDETVPAHHRFIALRALHIPAMPTPAYEQRINICAVRAARATADGPPQETARVLMQLLIAARSASTRSSPV